MVSRGSARVGNNRIRYVSPDVGAHSIRAFFDIFLRAIEVFLGIRFITHFFSEDGFLAGFASDIGNLLQFLGFDDFLLASSGIERPLTLLVFVLIFMVIGYIMIVFSSMSSPGRDASR